MRALALLLLGVTLTAQEASAPEQPFQEEARWWIPSGELRADTEAFKRAVDPFHRQRMRVHLRWSIQFGDVEVQAGSVHSLSSTSNRHDLEWFENLPSNGSALDLAKVSWRPMAEHGGGDLSAGLVDNPLLASEALWDSQLRVIGGGGRLFWRNDTVDELGLRAIAGHVRLMAGGRVALSAAQAVFRLNTGPIRWTLHGGIWNMEARQEDGGAFTRQNPSIGVTSGGPYGPVTTKQYVSPQFDFHTVGIGVASQGPFPFEIKGHRQTHVRTEDRGDELQVWVGSPRRTWWPQAGWIRQRVDPSGALASVNTDQWWFHANVDGNLYVLALNLPARWRMEVRHMDQLLRGASTHFKRDSLALVAHF